VPDQTTGKEAMEKKDIKSFTYTELKAEVEALGEKAFRAKQLYQWMHEKLAEDFDEMTNLPQSFRQKLKEQYTCISLEMADRRISAIDGTEKYLFRLHDGNVIESVLMRYHHGNSVCISSQAGCRMGCRFCASTLGGLTRNLTPSEMLDQVYRIQKISGERVSNLVVMGTGEPLDNYDNLLRFLTLLTDEHGLNISQRNVTVSTCGLVERIRMLADEQLQITLALSLHASSQEKRKELMPVAYKYELKDVLDACRYYFDRTGRRITFEYSLVGGVNDTREDAQRLAELVEGINCHVNLIPVNPIKERSYVQSDRNVILAFKNKLEKYHINVTIRREMGRDINGACGQLRKSYMDAEERK
jgi:23S rRNA (adenine2503-C2)-methyltransferase